MTERNYKTRISNCTPDGQEISENNAACGQENCGSNAACGQENCGSNAVCGQENCENNAACGQEIHRNSAETGKIRLDELIRDIYETETLELPGFMEKEQQKRIEARIMKEIQMEQEREADREKLEIISKKGTSEKKPALNPEKTVGKENSRKLTERVIKLETAKAEPGTEKGKRKKSRKRRFLVLSLAAVLLMGFCLGAFAGSGQDWDIEILRFMGLEETDTFQLESGEVAIQVYDTCLCKEYDSSGQTTEKKVRLMADSSIGDKNSACIRIDTDYELPQDFDDKTDYILPGENSIRIREKKEKNGISSMGSVLGYQNDNGKLGFMIYISDCKNLNRSYVHLTFQNFYLYHDLNMEEGGEQEELLLEGEWELEWKYSYSSNTQEYKMFRKMKVDQVDYYITNVELSPLSVKIECFRMPWDRKEPHTGLCVEKICYQDGTCLDVGKFSVLGNKNGIWINLFLGTTEMKTTIDIEQVESIVVGGNEIKLK